MSQDLYSYSQPILATAVPLEKEYDSDLSVYDSNSHAPWMADDAIEKSNNIFNQVYFINYFLILIKRYILLLYYYLYISLFLSWMI